MERKRKDTERETESDSNAQLLFLTSLDPPLRFPAGKRMLLVPFGPKHDTGMPDEARKGLLALHANSACQGLSGRKSRAFIHNPESEEAGGGSLLSWVQSVLLHAFLKPVLLRPLTQFLTW